MSISAPFIRRPVATSLLGVATLLAGILGYLALPVSALPQVEFPTIQVTTQMPGPTPTRCWRSSPRRWSASSARLRRWRP